MTAAQKALGLLGDRDRRVTYFAEDGTVVKVTRRFPIAREGRRSRTLCVTVGRPNYRERRMIQRGVVTTLPHVHADAWPKARKK